MTQIAIELFPLEIPDVYSWPWTLHLIATTQLQEKNEDPAKYIVKKKLIGKIMHTHFKGYNNKMQVEDSEKEDLILVEGLTCFHQIFRYVFHLAAFYPDMT